MALLSDDAEAAGLNLAFATALVSLAWAGGQVLGGSAVPASPRQPRTRRPTPLSRSLFGSRRRRACRPRARRLSLSRDDRLGLVVVALALALAGAFRVERAGQAPSAATPPATRAASTPTRSASQGLARGGLPARAGRRRSNTSSASAQAGSKQSATTGKTAQAGERSRTPSTSTGPGSTSSRSSRRQGRSAAALSSATAPLFLVGDSLSEGTQPYLPGRPPAWRVEQSVSTSRHAPRGRLDHPQPLGLPGASCSRSGRTTARTAPRFRNAIESVLAIVGNDPLRRRPDIVRPPVGRRQLSRPQQRRRDLARAPRQPPRCRLGQAGRAQPRLARDDGDHVNARDTWRARRRSRTRWSVADHSITRLTVISRTRSAVRPACRNSRQVGWLACTKASPIWGVPCVARQGPTGGAFGLPGFRSRRQWRLIPGIAGTRRQSPGLTPQPPGACSPSAEAKGALDLEGRPRGPRLAIRVAPTSRALAPALVDVAADRELRRLRSIAAAIAALPRCSPAPETSHVARAAGSGRRGRSPPGAGEHRLASVVGEVEAPVPGGDRHARRRAPRTSTPSISAPSPCRTVAASQPRSGLAQRVLGLVVAGDEHGRPSRSRSAPRSSPRGPRGRRRSRRRR